ncbi:fatty acid metabolism transcriptional regulator FadR [Aliikangiella coralliicola]|uniref:Fatty acid metabolism regulator protein n=1 Tax=Aliikangiella coralliicola TaxID=2592383 RepID=A0A545TWG0_9GAMM|nr:fatty acid metabolism transcriptional regulator FadR [Aliikangiella coralliicola]TQV81555.1 fatty acid metabolism transcriptional regulator FadR [Aliikangiella coralliicola]
MANLITARSPAAFAEEYIVDSIWNGKFAPGTILPAERELSELIGVTRTTLREVLQRLARDGWLTIQHGKPTRVNNIWETAGLHILDTITRLDDAGSLKLADQLLDVRTQFGGIYFRFAMKENPDKMIELFADVENVKETAKDYIEYDWHVQHQCAALSGNPVYILMLNGFRNIYHRIGRFYFNVADARKLAKAHYLNLKNIVANQDMAQLSDAIWTYGRQSGELWAEMRSNLNSLKEID